MTFDFSKKLFVSTIAEDCAAAAREHSLGLEIAEFCYAPNMDTDSAAHFRRVSQLTAESGCGLRLLLHAPFAELSPCAIDPLVRDVVRRRFDQALFAADVIGAKRIVFHSGFIPFVYYKEYFIDESVKFWRDFLKNAPNDIYFLLENVMEPEPEITAAVAEGVNDSRFGLCLDIGHANSRVSEIPLTHWNRSLCMFTCTTISAGTIFTILSAAEIFRCGKRLNISSENLRMQPLRLKT